MTLKQERMAERIREILSELVLYEVADPAVQGITITEVKLDRELEYATVYVNALGEEARQDEVMAGLRRASGFLRREVGARIAIRRTPELRWQWDETLERGAAMEAKLDQLDIPPAPAEDEAAS
jgi:ribosome-binding factor A